MWQPDQTSDNEAIGRHDAGGGRCFMDDNGRDGRRINQTTEAGAVIAVVMRFGTAAAQFVGVARMRQRAQGKAQHQHLQCDA